MIILSSGTTGAPKGAARAPSRRALLGPATTILEQVPLRSGRPILVAPPRFHGFGLAYLGIAIFLLILLRRFEARAVLEALAEHRACALVAVPVMLSRMLAARGDAAPPALDAILSAGAPLPPQLALEVMDTFGDVLFNLYGSTETGFAAVAGPADLRAAPGTVGRPPLGTPMKLLGEDRREVAAGESGHIFLGGELVIGGYEGGGSKELVSGLMNTGDIGHLDRAGRLFIDGREDDMIVSGGENVFPDEVGDVLASHPAVADVAVVGVPDEQLRPSEGRSRAVRAAPARLVVTCREVDGHALARHVKERVARYKVPRDFVFVDEIPRNQTGKVLRRRLEGV